MAFGTTRIILEREFKKRGYIVHDCPNRENYLRVDNKYDFCITNSYFRDLDGNIVGQGKDLFYKKLKECENND